MIKKVFITGINGCIGHYLYDVLSADPSYELHLLVRNITKIKFSYKDNPKVKIIDSTMHQIEKHIDLIREMDYIIHIAACWGGDCAEMTNVTKTLELFNMADPRKCKKIIYFSTASILKENNELLTDIDKIGTSYIVTKSKCYSLLRTSRNFNKIVTLFPTVVIGGDKTHPYPHASLGMQKIIRHINLIKYFSLDLRFHYIHSQEIALMTKYLIETDTREKDFVLGNPAVSFDDLLDQLCRQKGIKRGVRLRLTGLLIALLPFLPLSPWQKYCLKTRYFVYKTVNTEDFGIISPYRKLQTI